MPPVRRADSPGTARSRDGCEFSRTGRIPIGITVNCWFPSPETSLVATECGLPRPGTSFTPALEPDVHARGVPVVGFAQDVHGSVAIEVSDTGFVEAHAGDELGFAEVA